MNDELRKSIDEALPGLLRQAKATLSVNKMVKVSGERMELSIGDRKIEIVYYAAHSKNAPLIIGYHSGGWLFGGSALNDSMWQSMSDELDVNIASIGYAMAPKHKWRESLADSYDTAMYLIDNFRKFGFNKNKVILMGLSAGGNLATAVAINALKNGIMPFSQMLLLYPLLDLHTEPGMKGKEHFGGVSAYVMNEQHVSFEETKNILVSPVFASACDLVGFPETLCFSAENDALKHEDARFISILNEAGTKTRLVEMEGMSHCYFELGYRDRLTDFEKDFIGPLGVDAFETGAMKEGATETIKIIKEEFKL